MCYTIDTYTHNSSIIPIPKMTSELYIKKLKMGTKMSPRLFWYLTTLDHIAYTGHEHTSGSYLQQLMKNLSTISSEL